MYLQLCDSKVLFDVLRIIRNYIISCIKELYLNWAYDGRFIEELSNEKNKDLTSYKPITKYDLSDYLLKSLFNDNYNLIAYTYDNNMMYIYNYNGWKLDTGVLGLLLGGKAKVLCYKPELKPPFLRIAILDEFTFNSLNPIHELNIGPIPVNKLD